MGGEGIVSVPKSFFLCGDLRNPIYDTPVETEEDLLAGILSGCRTVQYTPGIFEWERQNMVRLCNACSEVGGHHFEQLV